MLFMKRQNISNLKKKKLKKKIFFCSRAEMESEFCLIEISLREMAAELLYAEKKMNEKIECNESATSSPNKTNDDCETITTSVNKITVSNSKQSSKKMNDKFIPVVKAFLEQAQNELRQTQILHCKMEEKVFINTKLNSFF